MGRPINKKFFGNLSAPYDNAQTGGSTGVGGEGVATVALGNTGTLYTTSTTLNVTFSNPQIKGGVKATGRVTTNEVGNVASFTLLTAGSGYTSVPTITVNGGTTGTTATFTVSLTTTVQNALSITTYLPTGTQAVAGGDIMKQEASRRYLVQNSEGIGQCKLVAKDALAAGEMNLIATDGAGSTFFVTKLTARKATVVGRTGTSTAVVTSGASVGWTLGVATGTTQVTLASN